MAVRAHHGDVAAVDHPEALEAPLAVQVAVVDRPAVARRQRPVGRARRGGWARVARRRAPKHLGGEALDELDALERAGPVDQRHRGAGGAALAGELEPDAGAVGGAGPDLLVEPSARCRAWTTSGSSPSTAARDRGLDLVAVRVPVADLRGERHRHRGRAGTRARQRRPSAARPRAVDAPSGRP